MSLKKALISKRILFKKIAIMHGEGEFSKIKGSICNIYFETVRPHIVYQALTYLKSYNKFYKDISIVIGLSNEEIFKFSDIF